MKKLVYLLVFSVFLGTQLLAIDIGFKLSLYRVLFLLILGMFGVQIINNDQRLRFYPKKLSSTYTSFYFLWLIYSIMSIVWSENLGGWVKANIFIGIGVFSIAFIQQYIQSKEDIIKLIKCVISGVSLHIIIGLFEIVTGQYFWASHHFMTKYQPKNQSILNRIPISIYPNQNDYATLILMGSFFIIFLVKISKSSLEKLFYITLWALSIFLVNQTDSRANVLAFLIGIGGMILVYCSKVFTRKGIFISISGLLATFIGLVIVNSSVREKIVSFVLLIAGKVTFDGSSNHERVNLIKNGFYFLKNTMGFGVGAGNIEYYMQTKSILPTDGISNMHNWWMEILAGYGVVIFALYIIVYISMIRKAYFYYRFSLDSFVRKGSISIIGYLLAFVLSSISSASNIINEWQWVIFGVIIAFFSYCERMESLEKNTHNFGGNHG